MKKYLALAVIVMFFGKISFAQHTEVEIIRSAFKLEKKAEVANFMNLPDSSAKKFWPIYNKYETERSAIGDRRVKLIEDYAKVFNKPTPAATEKLWKESAAIQKAEASLRERYADQVKKQISAKTALDFYMVEDYIATVVKAKLYSELPVQPK